MAMGATRSAVTVSVPRRSMRVTLAERLAGCASRVIVVINSLDAATYLIGAGWC